MATMNIVLMLVALMCCVLMYSSSALIHVVGGTDGWKIPPNTTFYAEWAKPRTFGIYDKIVFPYRPGAHNILQVSKEDFDKCGNDNVIAMYYKGPSVIQLNNTGDYYFYSGIGLHCEMGQKLHINVVSGLGSSGRAVDDHHAPAPAPVKNSASANVVQFLGVVTSSFLAMLFI